MITSLLIASGSVSRLNKYIVDLPPFCTVNALSPSAVGSGVFWNYCAIRNPMVVFNWKCSVEYNTSDDDSSVLTITNRQNIYPPHFPSLLGAT